MNVLFKCRNFVFSAVDPGSRGAYYLDQKPYDTQGGAPLNIILDGSRPEQRIPLQVLVSD
jgi:hypothetical protein